MTPITPLTPERLAYLRERNNLFVQISGSTDLGRNEVNELFVEIDRLTGERNLLRDAITEHHSQRADDKCWLDDSTLYAAAGLPTPDIRIGDPEAMLANCKRFIANRCEAGGPWRSYAELEADNLKLRQFLKAAEDRIAQLEATHDDQ